MDDAQIGGNLMFKGDKIPDVKRPKCIVCGKDLKLGEFAFNQDMCWECFEERVMKIAGKAQSATEADIILHLLNIAKEAYRRK